MLVQTYLLKALRATITPPSDAHFLRVEKPGSKFVTASSQRPFSTHDFAHRPKLCIEDLGMRYNDLEDDVVDSVKTLVSNSKTLRMLELGTTGMTFSALESISEEVVRSETLVVFSAKRYTARYPLRSSSL